VRERDESNFVPASVLGSFKCDQRRSHEKFMPPSSSSPSNLAATTFKNFFPQFLFWRSRN